MYSDNNIHAKDGYIVKVVNVFEIFKCKHRRLQLVDWGGNRTYVIWYEMTFLEIDYIDLMLMGVKNSNATLKETKDPNEGTMRESGSGRDQFSLIFEKD